MRRLAVLALVGALMVPAVAVAQSPDPSAPVSPDESAAPVVDAGAAYACIAFDPTAYEDADAALVDGGVELVDVSLCTIAQAPVLTQPVKESGKGTKRSKPFVLPAGDYSVRVKWGKGCPYSRELSDPGLMYLNLISSDEEGLDLAQSTPIYGIEAGRYYMKVNTVTGSKCSWSFTITPYEEES